MSLVQDPTEETKVFTFCHTFVQNVFSQVNELQMLTKKLGMPL